MCALASDLLNSKCPLNGFNKEVLPSTSSDRTFTTERLFETEVNQYLAVELAPVYASRAALFMRGLPLMMRKLPLNMRGVAPRHAWHLPPFICA